MTETTDNLTGMALYIAGVDQGKKMKHNLSSNENPYGCSQAAMGAIGGSLGDINRYPDRSAKDLANAIAEKNGLDAGSIFCGSGSSEIIRLLAQLYLGPGDEAIYTRYGFALYPIVIELFGATPVTARESDDWKLDIETVLDAVTDRTKVVFISNPGNPTGTFAEKGTFKELRARLRDDILLVIDEAYIEYVHNHRDNECFELMGENTLITRTFSKIYGLAGLRLGWTYAPKRIVDDLNRVCGPFSISLPAFNAGIAALNDSEFLDLSRRLNHRNKKWMFRELKKLGMNPVWSETNFLLTEMPDGVNPLDMYDYLLDIGYAVRKFDPGYIPNALRITVGDNETNLGALTAMARYLQNHVPGKPARYPNDVLESMNKHRSKGMKK